MFSPGLGPRGHCPAPVHRAPPRPAGSHVGRRRLRDTDLTDSLPRSTAPVHHSEPVGQGGPSQRDRAPTHSPEVVPQAVLTTPVPRGANPGLSSNLRGDGSTTEHAEAATLEASPCLTVAVGSRPSLRRCRWGRRARGTTTGTGCSRSRPSRPTRCTPRTVSFTFRRLRRRPAS